MQPEIITSSESSLLTFAQYGLLPPTSNSTLHRIPLTNLAGALHSILLMLKLRAILLYPLGIDTLAFSRNRHCQFKSSDRLGLLTEILT